MPQEAENVWMTYEPIAAAITYFFVSRGFESVNIDLNSCTEPFCIVFCAVIK